MKMYSLYFSFCLLLFTSSPLYPQVKLILDTDFGGDADDLGAVAMLHNFVERAECELLGIVCWSTERYAVSAIDAVNRFYKHPDVPIGVRKAETHEVDWNHSKIITENFPYEIDYESAEESTSLYRRLLAENKDHSVTIVTVGPLKNIQDLLQSGADQISLLDGKTLVEKKGKEFVIMGGQYPEGKWEWNFNGNMPGVTRYVLGKLKVPITFLGYELGQPIKTGEVFNEINQQSPLYIGFKHFSEHASWVNKEYKGKILDNSTYDQTAVLYAVRDGVGTWWDRIDEGYCVADNEGGNIWKKGAKYDHSYLKLRISHEEMAALIESFMLNSF